MIPTPEETERLRDEAVESRFFSTLSADAASTLGTYAGVDLFRKSSCILYGNYAILEIFSLFYSDKYILSPISVIGYEIFVKWVINRQLTHRGFDASRYKLELGDWSGGNCVFVNGAFLR